MGIMKILWKSGWTAALLATAAVAARADTTYPRPDWVDRPSPLASPHAVAGGEIVVYAGQYPQSFNFYIELSTTAYAIFGAMYETLLTQNPLTLEMEPRLARSWTLSDDRFTFTFKLDERARWSDGRPITAHDVLWTYETIMDEKNMTGPHKTGFERFEKVEVLDELTVRFTAREAHWSNLNTVGFFHILPKHAFEGQDFNKINFAFPVVSGPYRFGTLREGLSIRLERRADWWRIDFPSSRGTGNFQYIQYRYFAEQENAFIAFKKGDIDIFPVYSAQRWATQTDGERYRQQWIVKQEIYNYSPVGFQGFAMNMRRAPYDDLRVRRALAMLLNRRRMNETLMYNAYVLQRSFYEDLYSPENPCPNPLIAFDPEQAAALLDEAGWTVDPATGMRKKDGQTLVLRFLTREGGTNKILALYQEDLLKAGIGLEMVRKDGSAWTKDMDEFNYDVTWASWSSGLYKNPEAMWYSVEADRPAGQNITGYKNPEVDRLIEAQRTIYDLDERHALVRKIDAMLANEVPYVLLWNLTYTRLLYWNKFGMPPAPLGKYGNEESALVYWWTDPDAEAELRFAMKENQPLPARPARVTFDQAFPSAPVVDAPPPTEKE